MVRSIQVFRYEDASSEEDIFRILSKEKIVKYTTENKNNKSKKIEIQCNISEVKQGDYGVSGHFFYRYQEKINRYTDDEKYAIWAEHYDFLISPKAGIIIIHGSIKFRRHVRNLISQLIHQGLGFFKEIIIQKEGMMDLITEIRKDKKENNVSNPNFDFLEKKYNDWTELDFATGEILCVTNHRDFQKYYNATTLWSPKMRIKQCTGIVETPHDDRASLMMKYDASFTLSQHASPNQWNKFVFEKCKKSLGLR